MTIDFEGSIWQLELPDEYGIPPKKMSASTLNEIESCPRKYALRRANYPKVWKKYGYPPNPSLKALQGIILHGAIEDIITALKQANCPSVFDETFVKTMRSLNGFAGVLENQLQKISNEVAENPRLNHKTDQLIGKLRDAFPLIREQLQAQICKLKLGDRTNSKSVSAYKQGNHSLSNGVHSELELNADDLKWHGKVDYLHLSPNGCEIADFKSGERKLEHIFQIKIYNLLWILDKERNPNAIPVTKLWLSYRNEEIEIPPLANGEIESFIDEVKQRTEAAKNQISQPVPIARPSSDNCRYCSVRQLCSTFWTQETQRILEMEKTASFSIGKKNSFDIEIELEDSIAEHIWNARTLTCGSLEPETQLLVRFAPTLLHIPISLKPGLKLRLLNVSSLAPMDEETLANSILTNWQSESFIISKY